MSQVDSSVKLYALRRLSVAVAHDKAQVQKVLSQLGSKFMKVIGERLCDSKASDIERAACAAILDLLAPGWRKASPLLVGCAVRRSDLLVRKWRNAVLDRDGQVCTCCGGKEDLHAHHIVRWVDEPILRVSVDNGVTLCAPCHREVHFA